MAKYSTASPYYNTEIVNNQYLGTYTARPIPAEDDDVLYELGTQYTYRPDLLSYDLYGTAKLWWIFSVRNPEILKDPVFDMIAGTKIYLPKPELVKSKLGV